MDDEVHKRVIAALASRLSERFVEQPEAHSITDDRKEALLSAASSLILTIVASFVIRRVVGSR